MSRKINKYERNFLRLKKISLLGLIYKRFFSSPLLFLCARRFGSRIIEIGSGIGNGVLGTFPKSVVGIDINPLSVEYSKNRGFNAQLISENASYPFLDGSFDSCILDNVLEHIENPHTPIDECWRITSRNGGLVIAVPGARGFDSDPDHKVYYDEGKLRLMNKKWELVSLYAIPSLFLSQNLSKFIRQYCLVAVYKKKYNFL